MNRINKVFCALSARGIQSAAVTGLLLMIVSSAIQAQNLPKRQDEEYQSRYGALAERNIFVRDRIRRREAARPVASVTQPSIEHYLFVTGIVCKGEQRYAIVENQADGSIRRVYEQDRIGHGVITSIGIGRLFYRPDGPLAAPVGIATGDNIAEMTMNLISGMEDAE